MPCKKNRLCFLRSASSIRGSVSASAERKNRGLMGITHKKNATVEDKKISMAAASVINGSRRKSLGGRTSLGGFGMKLCRKAKSFSKYKEKLKNLEIDRERIASDSIQPLTETTQRNEENNSLAGNWTTQGFYRQRRMYRSGKKD
ncbi:Uncharacterized protein Rs2_38796 [Raphanus sativus]|nr:Uncharacterized protein Rs2_38796 [Raphanus sativus]